MSREREFEYEGYWLWRRDDTPFYYIYWCRPGTRRVCRKSTGTDDLEQAKRELITFVHKRSRPVHCEVNRVTILDAVCDYIERNLDGRASQDEAKRTLKYWTEFLALRGIDFVSELTLDVQEAYISWRLENIRLAGNEGSNGTINRELAVVRASLREYWKRGLLQTVPFIKSLTNPPPRERFLTEEEFHALLAECREPHLRRFVLLATHTLQRPGAIFELRIDQVDLVRNRISFVAPGRVVTNKRRAVVPITTTLRPELERAMKESRCGYVLEYMGRPIRSVRRAFANAAKRAGLDGVSPYVLRHTGATLAVARGVPLRQIAGMMGHTTTRTTEIHYAKHQPEFLKDAAAALDSIFCTAA